MPVIFFSDNFLVCCDLLIDDFILGVRFDIFLVGRQY